MLIYSSGPSVLINGIVPGVIRTGIVLVIVLLNRYVT
jgi:hypothetical protein